MKHIANHRYVVLGMREDDGRRWAIGATDDREEADRILAEGVVVNGRRWLGTRIHDRREQLILTGGYSAP